MWTNSTIIQAWPYLARAQSCVNKARCRGRVIHQQNHSHSPLWICPPRKKTSMNIQDTVKMYLWISSERQLLYWDGEPGQRLWTPKAAGKGTMSEPPQQTSGEGGCFPVCNPPALQLKPQTSRSPCGSPRMSPCGSPRSSPRHSPLLFRKLLMSRSIALQRRFTLAHTPRYPYFVSCSFVIKVTRPPAVAAGRSGLLI